MRFGKRRAVVPEGLGPAGCCCCLCSPLQSRKAGRRPSLALAAPRAPAALGAHRQGWSIALRTWHPQVAVATSPGSVLACPSPFPWLPVPVVGQILLIPMEGFRGHRTDHPLSLVLQMNRPIQVKPADSEGRGGRSPIPRLPGTGRGAQGHPGGDGGHGGIVGVAVGGLVCREIWERSCLCWWHPNLSAEQMPCSLSLSGQLGGTS